MITSQEVTTALYGVWRLAHFDENGWQFLDASIDGFWKSFFAAVLVAPAQAIMVMMSVNTSEVMPTAGAGRMFAVFTISYIIGWVVFPLIMAWIAEVIGKGENYVRYIVGYNWSTVIQIAVFFPVALIATAIGPGGGATMLSLIALLAVATYAWFIARTGLDVPASTAVAVVILDVVISIVLNTISRGMTGWL